MDFELTKFRSFPSNATTSLAVRCSSASFLTLATITILAIFIITKYSLVTTAAALSFNFRQAFDTGVYTFFRIRHKRLNEWKILDGNYYEETVLSCGHEKQTHDLPINSRRVRWIFRLCLRLWLRIIIIVLVIVIVKIILLNATG